MGTTNDDNAVYVVKTGCFRAMRFIEFMAWLHKHHYSCTPLSHDEYLIPPELIPDFFLDFPEYTEYL